MPILDMPLEKLLQYPGRNPKPADHDRYWEDALAEMNALDPCPELVPAEFTCAFADCFHLYFTGTKGARVHAQFIRPKNASEPHPAVLMFHGYAGHSGDFSDKLAYAAQGFTVAALDVRGQGGLSQDPGGIVGSTLRGHITRGLDDAPRNLFYRDVFLDTALLAKLVMAMPEVEASRVGAMGISQGGGLTLACAALVPSIQRIVPVYPFLSDYLRVWEMDLTARAYDDISDYFKRFDPLHQRHEEVFTRLGYIDVQFLCERIRADTLFVTGLMDTVCPPSSQFASYNKITAPKDLQVYPDFGHENLPWKNDTTFGFLSQL